MNLQTKAASVAIKAARIASFLLALIIAGCGQSASTPSSANVPAEQAPLQPRKSMAAPKVTATGKPYDFYLFTLSWSPEYCLSNPTSPECPAHLGFVVHGLWPENNDGTFPENCAIRPGPTSPSVWAGLLPTAALANHEWQTHGTCTPYDADTYFGLIRKAFGEVKIPADFTAPIQPASETPAAIVADFAKIDTGFPAGSIALSCGNNQLTAVEICLDKNLNAIACKGVKSCRANVVKIASRSGSH